MWEEGGVWGQAVLGSVPAQSLKEGDRPPRFARTEGVPRVWESQASQGAAGLWAPGPQFSHL